MGTAGQVRDAAERQRRMRGAPGQARPSPPPRVMDGLANSPALPERPGCRCPRIPAQDKERDPQGPPAPRSPARPYRVLAARHGAAAAAARRAGAIRAAGHVARPWAGPSRPAPAPATASSGPAPGGTGQGAPGRGERPPAPGGAGTARPDTAARGKVPENEALGALLARPGSRRGRRTAARTTLLGEKSTSRG